MVKPNLSIDQQQLTEKSMSIVTIIKAFLNIDKHETLT